ncbi:hypothetical protein NFI96_022555 [Prochilodus magdalenae]|nr:hypothetical protein NFI96_022555 [Prochilodus magdalenae]
MSSTVTKLQGRSCYEAAWTGRLSDDSSQLCGCLDAPAVVVLPGTVVFSCMHEQHCPGVTRPFGTLKNRLEGTTKMARAQQPYSRYIGILLARLVSDLQAFLLVLDSENLSYIAQAQKKSISELLSKLQEPKETLEGTEIGALERSRNTHTKASPFSEGPEIGALERSRDTDTEAAPFSEGPEIGALERSRDTDTEAAPFSEGPEIDALERSRDTDTEAAPFSEGPERDQFRCSGIVLGYRHWDGISPYGSRSHRHGSTPAVDGTSEPQTSYFRQKSAALERSQPGKQLSYWTKMYRTPGAGRPGPVEDAEYMIMNCPSGGPSSDLREGSVAEALDSTEHPLSSATSSEWLRRGYCSGWPGGWVGAVLWLTSPSVQRASQLQRGHSAAQASPLTQGLSRRAKVKSCLVTQGFQLADRRENNTERNREIPISTGLETAESFDGLAWFGRVAAAVLQKYVSERSENRSAGLPARPSRKVWVRNQAAGRAGPGRAGAPSCFLCTPAPLFRGIRSDRFVDIYGCASVGPAVPPHPPEGLEDDEDCYEEAEPFVPASQSTDKLDSDSSHYESYGEDEEEEDFVKDRAHYIQWSASQPCLRPVPESRICGYLWRKKWLGQWTRQLFIIKHSSLLVRTRCSSTGAGLYMHLGILRPAGLIHPMQLEHPHTVPADGAVGVEVEGHQAFWTCDDTPFILVLTTVPPHTDSLGVSTKTKAGLCFKCAKDLHPLLEINLRGCQVVYKSKHSKKMQHELKVVSGSDTLIMGFQSCSQAEEWRKIIEELSGSSYYEPESSSSLSILKSERLESCRSSTVLHTDSDEETLSGLPSAVSSIEISKDKDRAGYLNVLMNCQWQSLWCKVEDGVLKMFRDEVCEDTPQYTVQLRGSEVRPGPDTAHAYRITILQHGDQVAVLEVMTPEPLYPLQARTGLRSLRQ